MLLLAFILQVREYGKLKYFGNFSIPIEEIENEFKTENIMIGMKKDDLNFDDIKNHIYHRRTQAAYR